MTGEACPINGETGCQMIAGGNYSKTVVPNSRKVADWLGLSASNLPDLRDFRSADRYLNRAHLAQMLKQRPCQVERGGGRQNLDDRTDGDYLHASYMFGLLEPDKRRTNKTKDDGGWGSWRHGVAKPEVLPYANAYAEADAAWSGGHVNTYAATINTGRPPRHRPPRWSLFTCERIPRKPMRSFVWAQVAA
jgi:hypothetical protein